MIYSPKQTQKRCNLSKFELLMMKKLKKRKQTSWMIDNMLK